MNAPQTDRDQWIARVVDRQVAPIWHDRFARLIFRELPLPSDAFALDVHCGSGRTTAELLQRLDDSSRVLAVEPDEASITMAKTRVRSDWRDRVYFKHGDVGDLTNMATDSYDLTVANLVLGEAHDWKSVLSEFMRVTKPAGTILATVPLRGTWTEVEDLFREVLREAGMADAVRRLDRLTSLRPTGPKLAQGVASLGLDDKHFVVEQERFSLLFRSGREFLFSPVVEHGPLRLWKATLGDAAKPQELFWRLKEAIDTYYAGHVFSVSVTAGILRVQVPHAKREPTLVAHYWSRFPQLDALFRGEKPPEETVAAPPVAEPEPEEDLDLDIEMEVEEPPAEPDQAAQAATDEDALSALDPVDGPGTPSQPQTPAQTAASGPQTAAEAPVNEPDLSALDPVAESKGPPAVDPGGTAAPQVAQEPEPHASGSLAGLDGTDETDFSGLEDEPDAASLSGSLASAPAVSTTRGVAPAAGDSGFGAQADADAVGQSGFDPGFDSELEPEPEIEPLEPEADAGTPRPPPPPRRKASRPEPAPVREPDLMALASQPRTQSGRFRAVAPVPKDGEEPDLLALANDPRDPEQPAAPQPAEPEESAEMLAMDDLQEIDDPAAASQSAPAVELLAPDDGPAEDEELDIDSLLDQMFESEDVPQADAPTGPSGNGESGSGPRRRFQPPPPPPPSRSSGARKARGSGERSGKLPPPPPRKK